MNTEYFRIDYRQMKNIIKESWYFLILAVVIVAVLSLLVRVYIFTYNVYGTIFFSISFGALAFYVSAPAFWEFEAQYPESHLMIIKKELEESGFRAELLSQGIVVWSKKKILNHSNTRGKICVERSGTRIRVTGPLMNIWLLRRLLAL